MLQAVIPLEDFKAELHRRCDRIGSYRPFGKTIGTFCGPAQARAIETQQDKGKIMSEIIGASADSLATFKTGDQRRIAAHQTVVDYGASYLNSLVGDSAQETCSKIEELMPFVQGVIDRSSGESLEDMRPVLSFLVQSIWTAVQYEKNVSGEAELKASQKRKTVEAEA